MIKKSILIVEDEVDLAENIKDLLLSLDYEVAGIVSNTEDALIFLLSNKPDLALVDIKIKGTKDGVELAELIQRNYHIPIVFSTAYSDSAIMERAKEVIPYGYLVKPYSRDSLNSTIFIALSNFDKQNAKKAEVAKDSTDSILIRDKGHFAKILTKEILYLQADGLYTIVVTEKKRYTIKTLLKYTFSNVKTGNFIRVHKSYVVNLDKVESFNAKECIIGDENIPIARGIYKLLYDHLNKTEEDKLKQME